MLNLTHPTYFFLLAWFVYHSVKYAVIYMCLCVCISGLKAPESVGQYAVIFIYKDGKHNLASSVVCNLYLLFRFVLISVCNSN